MQVSKRARLDVAGNGLTPNDSGDATGDLELEQGAQNTAVIYENVKSTEKAGFFIAEAQEAMVKAVSAAPQMLTELPEIGELEFVKEADGIHFKRLLEPEADDDQDLAKKRQVLRLLLRIKNGTPATRKAAMRQITQDARSLGADVLFTQTLPVLSDASLDEKERHLMVKVVGRLLLQLRSKIAPFVHDILSVVGPLLMSPDMFSRREGRELIGGLAQAVGLKVVVASMRKDFESTDEQVRKTTAIALAVVSHRLGILRAVPLYDALCRTNRSWYPRYVALRSIRQLALIAGSGVLPFLNDLVACAGMCLNDSQVRVVTAACAALSSMAEAANPYGIEAFEPFLEALWHGARYFRGRNLAGVIQTLGSLVPLMDTNSSSLFIKHLLDTGIRQFASPDEEMKRVILRVIELICESPGLDVVYLRQEVLPEFFSHFWLRRLALDRVSQSLVIRATTALAQKLGASVILQKILDLNVLKDPAESFQHMGLETVKQMTSLDELVDLSQRLDERLIDSLFAALQHSQRLDTTLISAISTVMRALGTRCSPFLDDAVSILINKLSDPAPEQRQTAALIIKEIAVVLRYCDRPELIVQFGSLLYEQLGDDFPEVLAAVLSGLTGIVSVIGMSSMQPPIRDLLPRLTPILRNQDERVQETCIVLVGKIADRGSEYVVAREWIRVCFELLELFKSPRKSVRREANDTFGYIARGIGPQDVLATLLSHLRSQDRQSRVSTAVAISIVAEKCEPFTVLPVLLNEYRTPDSNVQNGVLKALSFLFEYIGDTSKDYLYSTCSLVDHALTDRNQVHRQTASNIVKHLALGCIGSGHEDVMVHFLNELIPNIFETSPHLISRVMEGIEGVRLAVGPGVFLAYVWAGLFHPARKVRDAYWQIYNGAYVQNSDAMVPLYPVDVPMADVWF